MDKRLTHKPTQKDFAAHIGVSQPAVAKLVAAGIIDLSRGTDAARLDYIAHLREVAAGRGSDGDYDLTAERARLAHHQANIAALDEQVKSRTLIPAEVVKENVTHMLGNMRARLLSLPSQLAATCAEAPRRQVEDKAMDLVRAALEELADDPDY